MPEISIIIPTFNSIEFIGSCLDSIFAQDYQEFEVIVIDNNSQDGTVGFIKENYPQVILIENRQNLGACKARNQGIEIALGSWIVTLDCDIILERNFISQILEAIKSLSSKIGMIQTKILKSDRKTIYSTGIYLSFLRRFYDMGKDRINNGQFNDSKYIFGACCAAAVYNRRMLEEIRDDTGYFDERFFFLVEDVDLAWRVKKKGWKALYCPEAICYHLGNSSGFNKKLRQYLCFRNRYYLILKNNNIHTARNIVIILLYDLPRLFYLMLTNSYIRKALRETKVLLSEQDRDCKEFK
jgi:GT2 family glycosyltransferase